MCSPSSLCTSELECIFVLSIDMSCVAMTLIIYRIYMKIVEIIPDFIWVRGRYRSKRVSCTRMSISWCSTGWQQCCKESLAESRTSCTSIDLQAMRTWSRPCSRGSVEHFSSTIWKAKYVVHFGTMFWITLLYRFEILMNGSFPRMLSKASKWWVFWNWIQC